MTLVRVLGPGSKVLGRLTSPITLGFFGIYLPRTTRFTETPRLVVGVND